MADASLDLRRSKRNKFHLDVTTMHLIHPERARKHPNSASPLQKGERDERVPAPPALSPQVTPESDRMKNRREEEEEEEGEMDERPEIKKTPRKRKSVPGRERNRPHKCRKCPASFDSMISLDLHLALHTGSKKHICDHCDYSSNSLHAVRTHTMMHRDFLGKKERGVGGGGSLSSASSSSPSTPSSLSVPSSSSTLSIHASSLMGNASSLSLLGAMTMPQLEIVIQERQDEDSSMEDEEEEDEKMEEDEPKAGTSAGGKVQTTFGGKYKCALCPFTTRDNERLERHNYGHQRAVGFLCPLCTFKTESAGFLKRHVEIHQVSEYAWPPQYVGISPRMNGIMEEREGEGGGPPTLIPIGKVLKAAHNASIPREKIGAALTALQQGRGGGARGMRGGREEKKRRRVLKPGFRWRREEKMEKCREKECGFETKRRGRMRGHKEERHWGKKIVRRQVCGECGARLRGQIELRVHRELRHRGKLCSEKKRIKWRDERSGLQVDCNGELPTITREKYQCSECSYSSTIHSRLGRHVNKHLLMEPFACKHCSFSCRSAELLLQHESTHFCPLVDKTAAPPPPKPATPIPVLAAAGRISRMETDSPPALERAESAMGGEEEMPVLDPMAPPVLEREGGGAEERGGKRGGRKNKQSEEEEEKKKPVFRLIEKAVRIRGIGVIGIRKSGGTPTRRYKCIHCPYHAPFVSMLWRHARHHLRPSRPSSSSSPTLHNCPECTFLTALPARAAAHRSMHAQQREAYACEYCQFVAVTSAALDEHADYSGHGLPSIQPVKKEDLSCIRVGGTKEGEKGISFNLLASLKRMRPSEGEKKLLRLINNAKNTRDLQCPDCPFSDPDELIFDLHVKMHKGPKEAFECNVCSYSSSTAEALHHHISLHLPPEMQNKRGSSSSRPSTIRRRHSAEVIPAGFPSFDCSSCNYRTTDPTAFQMHKLEHAQHIQQRLMTQIKRAGGGGGGGGGEGERGEESDKQRKARIRAATVKGAKQMPCLKCDFLCDTAAAMVRHQEFHGAKAPYECPICDYAASTQQITDFHTLHHHTKQPLAHLIKQAILMPESTKLRVPHTLEDKVRLAGQVFECSLCQKQFLEARLMLKHWEVDHARRGDDTACHLALEMMPSQLTITTA